MLPKSFLKIFFVSVGNILNAGFGFLFIAALAKSMDLETFGKYALLSSFLVSFAKITDFGTNSLFVSKSITKSKDVVYRFISTKIILFIPATIISFSALIFLKIHNPSIFIVFFAGLLLYTVNFTFFAFFQELENFLNLILLNTIPALIKGLFAFLIFAHLFNPSLVSAISIFSFSIGPSLLLFFRLPESYRSLHFNFHKITGFIRETAPAGLAQIINDSWSAISNSIAKLASGYVNVGIFSLSDKISNIFTLLSISIFTVLLPKNARRKRNKLTFDLTETFLLSLGIIALAFFAVGFVQLFFIRFFGEKFEGSINILDILIFASAATAIYSFIQNYFFVEEKTTHILIITLSKLFSFLLFCVILIPTYSLRGLAYSHLISAILAVGITLLFIRTNQTDANDIPVPTYS